MSAPHPPAIATTAARLYRAQQAVLSRRVAEGAVERETAEARLRALLRACVVTGADLPEITDAIADLRVVQIFPQGAGVSSEDARTHPLAEIDARGCSAGEMRAAVGRLRDAAIAALPPGADGARLENARALIALARALGCRAPLDTRGPLEPSEREPERTAA